MWIICIYSVTKLGSYFHLQDFRGIQAFRPLPSPPLPRGGALSPLPLGEGWGEGSFNFAEKLQ